MIENILNSQSATVQKSVFTRRQYTEPLTSGVGSTDVFAMKNLLAEKSATVRRDIFFRNQYPEPLESNVGREDLPGGFRWEAVMTGQKTPVGDLVRGIVQVDDVKVLFDARG